MKTKKNLFQKQQKTSSHRYLRPVKLVMLAIFGLSNVQAQEPIVLTLPDALNYALKANQNARKARLDLENSQYRIDEVRSRALPQISGSSSLTYNPLLQQSALPNIFGPNPNPNETILVAFGQKWGANAGIALSQALFDKSVLTGLKAARTTEEFYRLNAQLTEEQIIEQVATYYYQVLVQREQLTVIDSTIATTTKVQQIIKGQYNNGLARKIDVDRISVNISNLQANRQQLLNGIAVMENSLKFYMGMPVQTGIVIPPVAKGTIVPQAVLASDSLDLSTRTELRLLERQEDLLQYQKEAYKAEYYPSLSLSSNYSYQGIGNKVPVFKGKSQGVNWFDAASVSLNLRIPIFNGFATRSRIRQADVSIEKLKEDISLTTSSLNLAFENAKTQINNNLITLNNQQRNVELAQEIFFNTQNNYNNGLASLTDLLDAENDMTEAQNNYSTALLQYRLAEIQLIKAKGSLKSLLN